MKHDDSHAAAFTQKPSYYAQAFLSKQRYSMIATMGRTLLESTDRHFDGKLKGQTALAKPLDEKRLKVSSKVIETFHCASRPICSRTADLSVAKADCNKNRFLEMR